MEHERWACVCTYDGGHFLGWQSQKDGKSVQDTLEERLESIFRRPIRIHGSSRTDRGVHARGQVFHFDGFWPHGPEALLKALGGDRPGPLQILKVVKTSADFHARYGASGKRYTYRIHTGVASPFDTQYSWSLCHKFRLDLDQMRQGANSLLGTHDFSAFSALSRERNGKENPVKTLKSLDLQHNGEELLFITEASGYLYKMVRSLVGALIAVGTGKISLEALKEILESKQRTPMIATVPPLGLCLERVFYQNHPLEEARLYPFLR